MREKVKIMKIITTKMCLLERSHKYDIRSHNSEIKRQNYDITNPNYEINVGIMTY